MALTSQQITSITSTNKRNWWQNVMRLIDIFLTQRWKLPFFLRLKSHCFRNIEDLEINFLKKLCFALKKKFAWVQLWAWLSVKETGYPVLISYCCDSPIPAGPLLDTYVSKSIYDEKCKQLGGEKEKLE